MNDDARSRPSGVVVSTFEFERAVGAHVFVGSEIRIVKRRRGIRGMFRANAA
jgi:hypothetical protein